MRLESRKRQAENHRLWVKEYLIDWKYLTAREISEKYWIRYQTVNMGISKWLAVDEVNEKFNKV